MELSGTGIDQMELSGIGIDKMELKPFLIWLDIFPYIYLDSVLISMSELKTKQITGYLTIILD